MKQGKAALIVLFQTAAIVIAIVWFFAYIFAERHPQPTVLILGWAVLVPVGGIRLVQSSTKLCAIAIPPLLVSKNFAMAAALARYNKNVAQWFYKMAQLAGKNETFFKKNLYLSQSTLASCLYMIKGADEEIELRKELVEQAESLGALCDAGKNCDSISGLYFRKQDYVHTRHWAERAVHYYESVAADNCKCQQGHQKLVHKHAAAEALLAVLAQRADYQIGADKHAANAIALIEGCPEEDSELTMIRLINFSFDSKHYEQFETYAERYLNFKKHNSEDTFLWTKGRTLIRRGIICSANPARHAEAETLIRAGLEIADKLKKQALRKEGEKALAALSE